MLLTLFTTCMVRSQRISINLWNKTCLILFLILTGIMRMHKKYRNKNGRHKYFDHFVSKDKESWLSFYHNKVKQSESTELTDVTFPTLPEEMLLTSNEIKNQNYNYLISLRFGD